MSTQAEVAALRQEDDAETLRFILGNVRGRSFVWELLAQCNVFGASFTGDPLTSAFNEGRRDIGIRLLRQVTEIDNNAFSVMSAENSARELRYHVTTSKNDEEGEDL